MYNESAKKATIKYLSKNREQLNLTLPIGVKEKWKSIADEHNMSLTAYITYLIEKDNKGD